MKRSVKDIVWLVGIGLLYFIVFVFPNLKGAQNASMLAVFEIDEYAQYPHLIEMLTPGSTLYQSVRNFLIYQHYFYGYPFYFLSALAALPVKLILGAGWPDNTPVIMAGLRQLINVLPMILAAYLLTRMHTRLRPLWKAAALLIFLLLLPAAVGNNLWWHPDSLQVLAGVLVLFFLDRDDLRFGRNFFAAAALCGVAAGIKYEGVFFALAVPLYLAWGLASHRLKIGKTVLLGLGFVGLMALTLVITNPLLLLPQERQEVIANQILQFQQTSQGILQAGGGTYFTLGTYPADFRIHYGELAFVLIGVAALIWGLIALRGPDQSQARHRRLLALTAAWIVPAALTINFSATRRTFYFLPVVLPLFACLGSLPFERVPAWWKEPDGRRRWAAGALAAVGLAVALQGVVFVRADVEKYAQALAKEETSASIAFYKKLDTAYLPRIKSDKLVIYRDWHVYFPSRADRQIEMSWDMVDANFIRSVDPDLILLDRENLNLFANPASVENAVDQEKTNLVHEFYQAAQEDSIPGYTLLYEDAFGLAFVRTGLYKQ